MAATTADRFDVFVGNVRDSTTEEQLQSVFSVVGPVKKVRILIDQDTGRPKGFAFVEYHDANTALAAIRHLDGHELNSRRLRVSYSNNSNLKEVAQTISSEQIPDFSHLRPEFHAVKELYLHEAWDVLDAMKRLVDEDRARARTLLESYPQVVEALVQIQRRLGMLPTVSGLPSGTGGERHNVEQSNSTGHSSSTMASGSSQGSGGFSGSDPIQQAIQMARAQAEARLGGSMGRPSVAQPPPQSQSSQPPRGMGGGLPQLPPEIEEIMQLSDEQIMNMALDQRHHVMAIREEVYASLGLQMPPPPASQRGGFDNRGYNDNNYGYQ